MSRIPQTEEKSPAHSLAFQLLTVIRSHAASAVGKVIGTICITPPDPSPNTTTPAIVVNICAQPAGGYLCWFTDGAELHLYALVNDNIEHLVSLPATHMAEFQAELTKIQKEMGE